MTRLTFAHLLGGDTLRTDVYNPASAPAGQVCIEHAHVFLEFLLGMAAEGLAALDQDCLVQLVMEAYHREPPTVSEGRHLNKGQRSRKDDEETNSHKHACAHELHT